MRGILSAAKLKYPSGVLMLSAMILAMSTSCSEVPAASPVTGTSGPAVVVEDAWVKATDKSMTGVFGKIKNTSDQSVTIESAAVSLSDAELHEVSQGVMKKAERGFVIGPHSVFSLSPGANHIMLIGLKRPLAAGEDVRITLRISSAEDIEFTAVVKEYTGANENYAP